MSLIDILNSNELTIEPCGTPIVINRVDKSTSSIFIHCFLSDKYLFTFTLAVPDKHSETDFH